MDRLDKEEGQSPAPDPGKGETLQPKKLIPDEVLTRKQVYRSLFTDGKTFKEFVVFIKQGFKLSKDDQKRKG